MPVILSVPVRCIDQQAFSDLDYDVMQNAFQSQNQLGRLCDEAIYQNDLEALCYFLGGEDRLAQPVKLVGDGVNLGNQRLYLLTSETAFRLTALTEPRADYEQSLLALLGLSPLRAIHWVNLGRHRVEFMTLTK